jgi:tRNA (guanosine-2'-O-)-methyltransferase
MAHVPPERRAPLVFPPAPDDFTRKRLDDGSFGPHGIYGKRVPRSDLLDLFRCAVKPARLARIEQVLMQRCKGVTVCFENLVDPANGSACVRTCEAFGLSEVHAVESYEPFRTTTGITMNADKWMTTHRYRHCSDAIQTLRASGFTLVATCLDDDAIPVQDINFLGMPKIALLFGNEERGLSIAMREAADVKACIPMAGFSQSLNICKSGALLKFGGEFEYLANPLLIYFADCSLLCLPFFYLFAVIVNVLLSNVQR